MITQHLLITGKVQGVFYRASAKKIADELGIKGWIRNLPDGNVEALVEGEPAMLNRFIAWCHKGPDGAIVKEVFVTTQTKTTLVNTPGFNIV